MTLARASISEGFCPRCSTPLNRVNGICACCGWSWHLLTFAKSSVPTLPPGHRPVHTLATVRDGWLTSRPVDQDIVPCEHFDFDI